jgi:cytidylate kinase
MNAMQRKHIITLSGKPGSGKSSTADRVAEMLGYTRYSTGDLVRTMLKKRKLTLAEFNTNAERDPQIDYDLDEELRKMREEKDVVMKLLSHVSTKIQILMRSAV